MRKAKPFFFFVLVLRPVVGSKTEARGLKAHAHVFKEILELCEIINAEGNIRFIDDDGEERIGILFGDLFRVKMRNRFNINSCTYVSLISCFTSIIAFCRFTQ